MHKIYLLLLVLCFTSYVKTDSSTIDYIPNNDWMELDVG